MFSKFNARRATPTPPPEPVHDPMDIEFLHAAHTRALQHRVQSQGFQGSFATAPGFRCQTQPDGMEVAVNEARRFYAIMAENVMLMSGVGYQASPWCLANLSIFCRHAFGADPDWQPWQNGLAATVPLAPGAGIDVEFRCQDSSDIDYNFSGQTHDGATLFIELKTRTD